MSGISQQKVGRESCRGGCDSLLDNWRASLHHFPCLVSGQLHRDCKHCAFPQRNCCTWQVALLFRVYFHLILVHTWSQNRMDFPREAGKSWVAGGAQVMVFLSCRESLETIHQENWQVRTKAGASWCWNKHQGFKCFYFIEADCTSPAPCQPVPLYLAGHLVCTCQV